MFAASVFAARLGAADRVCEMARASDNDNSMGDAAEASMATRSPFTTSSTAPRAMVRLPSERISITMRAMIGRDSPRSTDEDSASVTSSESQTSGAGCSAILGPSANQAKIARMDDPE